MKKIILYGASDYGCEVADHIKDINDVKKQPEWEIAGFLDDDKEWESKIRSGIPVLGNKSWLENKDLSSYFFLCCIGNPRIKFKVISLLDSYKVKYSTIVHPSVIKSSTVNFGDGCIIMAGNIISTMAKIENHVIINIGCTIGHNTVIGKYSCINPGSNISGNVGIESGVLVGTNATILENLKIGKDAVVSASAMVYSDVPEKMTVMGVPARIIKGN